MGSKRPKKSKQEVDIFTEKNDIKTEETNHSEPKLCDSMENNGPILTSTPIPKATKRKRKKETGDEVVKKVKKANDSESDVHKVKLKKKKVKNNTLSNGIENEQPVSDIKTEEITKSSENGSLEKKKLSITMPYEDIIELINRIEGNIPESDDLAYKSRVERLNWETLAFKNYSPVECKTTWLQVQKRIRRFRLLKEILTDAKEWANTQKTNINKPVRPRRHPDMPKRPLSSYLLFYLNKKNEIITANPGLDGSDISKIAGKIYNNLPLEKREPYEKLAASNKEEYEKKLKIFFKNHPEYVPPQKLKSNIKNGKSKISKVVPVKIEDQPQTPTTEVKIEPGKLVNGNKDKLPDRVKPTKVKSEKVKSVKVKSPKDDNKTDRKPGRPPRNPDTVSERPPKKNCTPFGIYYATELEKMESGANKSEFRDKCKEQYKQMPDIDKVYWINLAEQDLLRYQEEIKVYTAKYPDFKTNKIRPVLTKREKASKERASGKPVKPPNSAYALFSKIMLQSDEIKTVHPRDRMNYIANKWKSVPEEEQNTYRDQVVHSMEQYKREYQAYIDSLPEEERNKILQPSKRKNRSESQGSRSSSRVKKPKKRKASVKVQPPKTKYTEPEQPPISACKYFVKIYTGEGDPTEAWKALSPKEKRKYHDELLEKKQEYILKFEKFLKSLSKEELEAYSQTRQQQIAPSEDEDSSECSSNSESEGEDGDEDEESNEQDQIGNETRDSSGE